MKETGTCATLALAVAAAGGLARAQCADWGPGTNLSQDAGRYAVDGHTAVDSAGAVHVIYQSFLDTSGRNYYTTDVDGCWSTPVNLGSTAGKGSAPKIVVTPDQQLHVFYGKNDLFHRSKPVSGGAWSSSFLLTQGSFIYNAVVDSTGGIHFVYGHLFDSSRNPRNAIWSRYLPPGGSWGDEELVYGNNDDGNWPRASGVAVRGDVVWCGIEVNSDLYLKKRPAGGPWPAGVGAQFYHRGGALQWAFSPDGSEVAGFYHDPVTDTQETPWFEIFVRYSYDDGNTWTSPQNISDMTVDIDRSPQVAYDAAGNLHVVWEGFCCDHECRIRYRGRIGGYWGDILNMMPSLKTGLAVGALQPFGNTVYLTHAATGPGVIGKYDVFLRATEPTQPVIHVQPTSLSRTLWVHETLADDAFTLVNGCPGTLNYSVTTSRDWIQVQPTSGSSLTEPDTISVSYPGIQQVRAGTYHEQITVSGNAANSPVILPLTVSIQTVKPDLDGDEDVDQEDFGLFQSCLSGAFVPQEDPACLQARFDVDDDVDQDDAALFIGCVSGAGIPARRSCLP